MADWETEISSSGENAVIRGEPLENVMEMNFVDSIWLLLRGKNLLRKNPRFSILFFHHP